MSDKRQVLIYGASGYTGKLIAESLHKLGIPFTAVGRDEERLRKALEIVAQRVGVESIDAEAAAVAHDEASLTELFRGARVVVNVTGPFTIIGEPVVRAALNAGCHYLDTTGEQDFMLDMKAKYHEAFAENGLLLAPATAYMWCAGGLACEVALEDSSIDSLDVTYYQTQGTPSVASAASFMRMLACPHHYLKNNELVEWERAKDVAVSVPYVNELVAASAWGGCAEPAWYADDERVRNCKAVVGFDDASVRDMIHGGVRQVIEMSGDDPAARDAAASQVAASVFSTEPEKESPLLQRAVVNVEAWGNTTRRNVQIHLHSPYMVTGELIAAGCQHLLNGEPRKTGFQSAGAAFGHRELLSFLADRDYLVVKSEG